MARFSGLELGLGAFHRDSGMDERSMLFQLPIAIFNEDHGY